MSAFLLLYFIENASDFHVLSGTIRAFMCPILSYNTLKRLDFAATEMFKQCEKVAKSCPWCSRRPGNCYNGAF